MLTELHIENLGVIERAQLVFDRGMTVLTGETGAGKTMLVEAIELLVGGRADAAIVRAGAGEARVEGRFVGNVDEDESEFVLTRVVPVSGRSRAYVNGRLATASTLSEMTMSVIDLHGQHAHQSLLATSAQRHAVDAYGGIDLEPLRMARAAITEIEAELATLGGDERARAREIDLLRFQVDELDHAGITDADEDAALDHEERVLADAVGHREAAAEAAAALSDEQGAGDSIAAALRAVGEREPFVAAATRLTDLTAELDDIVRDLRDLGDTIDEDPERLEAIRERRQLLRDLRRKYGDDIQEIMDFHAEAERRLRELEQYDRRAAELDVARAEAIDAERVAAAAVGHQRRAVAPVLAATVEQRLRTLAMPNAGVDIQIGDSTDDHPGDSVRFLLAANPGSPLLPLSRVASGGELARTMLALRLVLTGAGQTGSVSTLVFDEVDAGIGGSAATAVGEALSDLGETHQVLVVTHLAQVAANAERQFVVSKTVAGGETFATVAAVDGDDRITEVARMLDGTTTKTAIEHARALLSR